MNNIIKLNRRVDLWRTYRDQINSNSLRNNSTLTNDKKLAKLLNAVDAIDPIIAQNLDNEIELLEFNQVNTTLSSHYEALNFNMDQLNDNLLVEIASALSDANSLKNKFFLLDDAGKIISNGSSKFNKEDNSLPEIETRVMNLQERIQKFPKLANDDLTTLNDVLEKIKHKLANPVFENKVLNHSYAASYNFKKIVIISLSSIFICIVLLMILIILALVL